MRRFFAGVSLLFGVWAVVLSGIRYAPSSATVTPPVFAAIHPGDCPMPCWFGVQPGVTTMTEAVTRLVRHPLIDPQSIRPFNSSSISFSLRWKDRTLWGVPSSRFVDSSTDILVVSDQNADRVGYIAVNIALKLGDFYNVYGFPRYTRLERMSLGLNSPFYMSQVYPELGAIYILIAPCRTQQNVIQLEGITYMVAMTTHDVFQRPIGGTYWSTYGGISGSGLDQAARRNGCP